MLPSRSRRTTRHTRHLLCCAAGLCLVVALLLGTGSSSARADTGGGIPATSPATIHSPLGLEAWLAVQRAELTPTDGADYDFFGLSVALSGDTAVVGTNNHASDTGAQGAAYVFTVSDGEWVLQQELSALDGGPGEAFGWSVALSGDTAVVGAPGHPVGANGNEGAGYVFTRSDGVWTQEQELTASDGAANDQFGRAVAVSGDTVVVGASGNEGAAYVFTRSAGDWTQQELSEPDGSHDGFGSAVAVSGDTAVVSAPGRGDFRGVAYIYTSSGGDWTLQQELTASDGGGGDWFGYSVALSGDTALVGAPYRTVGDTSEQGAAYAFTSSDGDWTQQQELTASDAAAGDLFGFSVSVDGDIALVGAQGHWTGGHNQQGDAYLFTRSAGDWTQHQELAGSDGRAADGFGWSVSLDGDTALVGAPFRNTAYVFAPVVPPANTAPPVVSGSTGLGDTLSCTSGDWTGDPTPSLGYQWLRDGEAIPWATDPSYTIATADQGHLLACLVTATNLGGTLAETSNLVAVAAVSGAPTSTAAPTVSGTARLGQPLSCTSGGWTGTVTSLSYEWLRDGIAIPLAHASSHRITPADCGRRLSCIVTAANGTDRTSAASDALAVEARPAPSLRVSRRTVTAGDAIVIRGTVKNGLPGARTVCVCRRLSGHLVVLRRLRLTSAGAFRCTWRSHRSGLWRFVATYSAAGYRFTSRAVSVVVRSS